MDDAERLIAFGDRADDDAETENIGKLLEADGLSLHFAPDRISALAPSGNVGSDATVAELFGELLLDLGDPAHRTFEQRLKTFGKNFIGLGVEFAERQVFQFLAH